MYIDIFFADHFIGLKIITRVDPSSEVKIHIPTDEYVSVSLNTNLVV